jgi:hypothetical protein
MTKRVRVENADSGTSFKVVVQVWDKSFGPGEIDRPDTLVSEHILHNPCDITGYDVYITDTRYLIVKELKT